MVRWIIARAVGGASIYGPLAAPIVLLIWLYVLAIAVLIGAALNAAVETVWPRREIAEARRAAAAGHRRRSSRAPGMDTGEVELPPNRPPGKNPLAGRARPALASAATRPRTHPEEEAMTVAALACPLLPGAR